MQRYFEKIKEKLEEYAYSKICDSHIGCPYKNIPYIACENCGAIGAIEIVNQVEEEFATDTNAGSKDGWIPCSERLPENTDPVNITWVNHNPEPYYADIKDKTFTATGCYCDGKWYWYSALCQAYLDEYRYSENDYMDNGIEVIAWMPLPEPYKGD